MNIKQIIGLIIAVAGIALVANAKFTMDHTGETVRKKLTGHYTSDVHWRLYGGMGLVVVGALGMAVFRQGKKKK